MKASDLCMIAKSILSRKNGYLKGFWGQYGGTKGDPNSEYNRVLRMYPDNKKFNNEDIACDKEAVCFDCICMVKAILGGFTSNPLNRISYSQMAANPVGDCTTQSFKKKLYETCSPKDAKAGYGLATDGHAAIALGSGMWIDCNYSGSQNGVALHTTGIERFDVAGKIPGVEYDVEYDDVKDFLNWLYDSYKASKK